MRRRALEKIEQRLDDVTAQIAALDVVSVCSNFDLIESCGPSVTS